MEEGVVEFQMEVKGIWLKSGGQDKDEWGDVGELDCLVFILYR